ncbi:RICIN domain-containing protein, partial [Streptomyces sp. NPDC001941]|uniref:RICIN domain-containing protein n=1 Tax=Streptomyces sp. NPDC001941 TaxID=3154659 RepID=UPI00331A6772
IGITSRSWQGGCLAETETRNNAVITRTDNTPDLPQGRLLNAATGWCADLPNAEATYGAYTYQYPCVEPASSDNQQFEFVHTRGLNVGGTARQLFMLKNTKSGQCVDVPNAEDNPPTTKVGMYTCVAAANAATDNQEWYWVPGPGLARYLVNAKSGLCLDVPGWASDNTDKGNANPLTLYPCQKDDPLWGENGADDHLWFWL